MKRVIAVFRTGTHTDAAGIEHTFTAEHLRAIADQFDADATPTPIVKGHPANDDPAFGWIERFLFEESSGILYAVPKDVDPNFAAEVKAKRFQMVSVALYPPTSPRNPKPGIYYPRHVGYLGAATPAVKGLKAANFTDNDEGFLMFDSKDDAAQLSFAEKLATAVTTALVKMGFKPAADEGNPGTGSKEPDVKGSTEYKELETEHVTLQRQLATMKAEQAKLEAKTARVEVAAFTEQLTTEGKLTPVEAGRLTEVLFAMNAATEIEFSEGEGADAKAVKAKPADMLRDFLKALPKRVEFSELSGTDKDGLSGVRFSAPEGAIVRGGARMDLHNRALAYAEQHKVEYLEAVSILSGEQ